MDPGSNRRSSKRSSFLGEKGPLFELCSSRLTLLLKWELWMIRFSAGAIFASSTSKFGIEILRIYDEDLNSSTESTNTTSLIHCIASAGNCELVHTSVLNLIFQQAKVAGVGNLSKWRSEICSRCWSAPWFFENLPSIRSSEFLADGPDWHLWSWFVLAFHSSPLWTGGVALRLTNSVDVILADDVLEKTQLDLQKSPDIPGVSRILGRPIVAARHSQRTTGHSTRNWMRWENIGWLVTWEFPLRTDSASWTSLESFIPLISLCNSWIFPVSSWIVSWSPTNLRLSIVSMVELWNFFNSSVSLKLLSWASRKSKFCSNNLSWRSYWSRRWSSSAWTGWSSSCCDSIVSINFCILLRS